MKCTTGIAVVLLGVSAWAAPATRPAADALRIERALAQLQGGDWIVQWEAMHDLAILQCREAIAPLNAILDSKAHPFVRSRALVALARIDGRAVYDRAAALAQDPAPEFRAAAVESLGLIGDERGRPIVLAALKDAEASVRKEALVAYARMEKAAAWPLISAQLAEKDTDRIIAAVRPLMFIGTDEAFAKLVELLDHRDRYIRWAVIAALAESRKPSAIAPMLKRLTIETDKTTMGRISTALAAFEYADLATPLLSALDGDRPVLYPVALSLLALSPTRDVCDRVAAQLPRLEQHAPESLPAALKLLARVDADAYAKTFLPYVEHKLPEVRKAAIDGVGRTATKGVDYYALLRPRLADPDKSARAAAYQAMRRTTRGAPAGGIVEYLKAPLESEDRAIHTAALELLRERLTRLEVPAALTALDRFLAGGDQETRRLAASILEGAGDERTFDMVARAQGYPSPWMIIGPFEPNPDNGNGGGNAAFPPEQEIDLTQVYDATEERKVAWALVQSSRTDGLVDLTYIYTAEDEKRANGQRIAYGTVNLIAAADTTAHLAITARSASILWINGQKAAEESREEYQVQTPLKKGTNTLLVKVSSADPRMWYYRIQVLDKDGKRLAGVSSAVPTAPNP